MATWTLNVILIDMLVRVSMYLLLFYIYTIIFFSMLIFKLTRQVIIVQYYRYATKYLQCKMTSMKQGMNSNE